LVAPVVGFVADARVRLERDRCSEQEHTSGRPHSSPLPWTTTDSATPSQAARCVGRDPRGMTGMDGVDSLLSMPCRYLKAIDNAEIIEAVRGRRAPTVSVSASLRI
jgi:hypothetical protein